MGICGFGMIKVNCFDLDRSIAFYETLGLELNSSTDRAEIPEVARLYGVTETFARTAALEIAGRMPVRLELVEWLPTLRLNAPTPANTAGTTMFSVISDDLDADLAIIENAGGGKIGTPFAIKQGGSVIKLGNAHDPDGQQLQLVQMKYD